MHSLLNDKVGKYNLNYKWHHTPAC